MQPIQIRVDSEEDFLGLLRKRGRNRPTVVLRELHTSSYPVKDYNGVYDKGGCINGTLRTVHAYTITLVWPDLAASYYMYRPLAIPAKMFELERTIQYAQDDWRYRDRGVRGGWAIDKTWLSARQAQYEEEILERWWEKFLKLFSRRTPILDGSLIESVEHYSGDY